MEAYYEWVDLYYGYDIYWNKKELCYAAFYEDQLFVEGKEINKILRSIGVPLMYK